AYFAADRFDGEAVARCFTGDALVKDEGHTYKGRAEIRKWKDDVAAKYQYTIEPLACDQQDATTVVTCRLKGNFPGSPVNLRFFFQLNQDRIASLEVTP